MINLYHFIYNLWQSRMSIYDRIDQRKRVESEGSDHTGRFSLYPVTATRTPLKDLNNIMEGNPYVWPQPLSQIRALWFRPDSWGYLYIHLVSEKTLGANDAFFIKPCMGLMNLATSWFGEKWIGKWSLDGREPCWVLYISWLVVIHIKKSVELLLELSGQ